jgi:hypothetical protein
MGEENLDETFAGLNCLDPRIGGLDEEARAAAAVAVDAGRSLREREVAAVRARTITRCVYMLTGVWLDVLPRFEADG